MCKVCFHIHLLKVESFSTLTQKSEFKALTYEMIWDVATSSEANDFNEIMNGSGNYFSNCS